MTAALCVLLFSYEDADCEKFNKRGWIGSLFIVCALKGNSIIFKVLGSNTARVNKEKKKAV